MRALIIKRILQLCALPLSMSDLQGRRQYFDDVYIILLSGFDHEKSRITKPLMSTEKLLSLNIAKT